MNAFEKSRDNISFDVYLSALDVLYHTLLLDTFLFNYSWW